MLGWQESGTLASSRAFAADSFSGTGDSVTSGGARDDIWQCHELLHALQLVVKLQVLFLQTQK